MRFETLRPLARLRIALLISVLSAAALTAFGTEPADLWEDHMQVEMSGLPAGMASQVQTHRRCSPRSSQTPPVTDTSGRCTVADVTRSGSGMSWKMRCEGDPPMVGAGEIHYDSRDTYHGRWTMQVGGRDMAMKIDGRRIGECDADDALRQLAAAHQQAAAAQRQAADIYELQCKSAVENLMSQALRADQPHRCDPDYKQRFCRRLQSADGFRMVGMRANLASPYGSGSLEEGAAFCGDDSQRIAAQVCQVAEHDEDLDLLSAGCVARGYGRALVVRECAGRGYSSPPAEKYSHFCSTVGAQHRIAGVQTAGGAAVAPSSEGNATPTAVQPAQAAIETGKQFLKGLFGR